MDQKTDRFLGRTAGVANATLAVALGLTLAVVAWPRVERALGMEPRPQPPAYAAGQTVDVPADWYASAPYTLVLFARASCGACQQASPFLQQLVREMRGKGDVLFASPGLEPESDREYARALGVPDDRTRHVPAGLRVRATPTLVLVDRTGRIHGAWEGVGPADQQARIQHEIQRTIHAVSSAD